MGHLFQRDCAGPCPRGRTQSRTQSRSRLVSRGMLVMAWPPLLVREPRGSGLSAEGVAAAEHVEPLGWWSTQLAWAHPPSLSPAQAWHAITLTHPSLSD